jgi:uncharacterized protein
MSQENVEVVRQAFRAYEREGVVGILPFCDAEIEWRNLPNSPIAGVFQGHEGVLEWQRLIDEGLGELHFEPQQFIEAPDNRVVVVSRVRTAGRGSGLEIEVPFVHVVSIAEGKATAVRMYSDVEDALEAAGLSE